MPTVSNQRALVAPFLTAAQSVLETELGVPIGLGTVVEASEIDRAADVTVLVAITGELQGTAMYSYSLPSALGVVSHLMGSPVDALDELAESGLAELGNMITGRGCVLLAEQGFTCSIAPPVVISGTGLQVHALNLPQWQSLATTPWGELIIRLALRSAKDD